MKFKVIALSALLCVSIFSCGNKSENSYSSPETSSTTPTLSDFESDSSSSDNNSSEIPDSKTALKESFEDVSEAEKGPVLSINNTTAKAGEVAEVIVSVDGADLNWSNCGIHITYPDVLKCVYQDGDDKNLKYEVGKAAEYNTGMIAMEWKKENAPPEELVKQHLGTAFFTTMFSGNRGQDGEIIKLYLEIPSDAESGTVYPLDFYYMSSDMFRNIESDMSLEKYAFEHTKAGSITVE